MAKDLLPSLEDWPSHQHKASLLGQETLYNLPNDREISLADGYIPLLVNLTLEDKAAKGLRKHQGGGKRETAVYVSALEAVRDNRILLLTGESGSGKTTLATYLTCGHASGVFHHAEGELVPRNDEGERLAESWKGPEIVPVLVTVRNVQTLQNLEASLLPFLSSWADRNFEVLLILDAVGDAGKGGAQLLASIVNTVRSTQQMRLLLLSREEAMEDWALPPGLSRLQLLPLLRDPRRDTARKMSLDSNFGTGDAASLPAIFVLSLMAKNAGHTPESALDAWLSQYCPLTRDRQYLLQASYDQWQSSAKQDQVYSLSEATSKWPILSCTAIQELLVAAHLNTTAGFQETLRLFDADPRSAAPVLRSLLRREANLKNKHTNIIEEILDRHDDGPDGELAQRAALLVCQFIDVDDPPSRVVDKIRSRLLRIVTLRILSISYRVEAGRYLSRWVDSRDLTALVKIPDGTSPIGASSHPNSCPAHEVYLRGFKIGAYPVVSRDYREFVQETGRAWPSADGYDVYAQNAPATDLTWHDARAYCQWLTARWRASGKIASHEKVRLPSEPEWERASRGVQRESHAGQIIYPWGTTWSQEASNCEELALNNKCAVGLFPKGRSPFGCYDMSGHVWEWCTTLWGTDMTTPTFRYPWSPTDGREDLHADDSIRRVLRGGCFSSGEAKATCSYRGSLEPTGFWRGNGFRIVVVSEELGK